MISYGEVVVFYRTVVMRITLVSNALLLLVDDCYNFAICPIGPEVSALAAGLLLLQAVQPSSTSV
jgi:hypothetical protein